MKQWITHQPTLGAEGVMDTFRQMLKAQTDAMTAQVKAATMQSLPSRLHYSGKAVTLLTMSLTDGINGFVRELSLLIGQKRNNCIN